MHMSLPEELLIVQEHLQQRPQGLIDFAHILSYIPSETIESVISACKIAIQSETIRKDVRKRRNKKQQNPHPKFILVLNTPRSRYNQLLRAEL